MNGIAFVIVTHCFVYRSKLLSECHSYGPHVSYGELQDGTDRLTESFLAKCINHC